MAEPDKRPYCDLIMKGGITSGVIYPRLMSGLAKVYRFKSIGGTSAGAIAAAGCAAAEYGRNNGVPGTFDELERLPGELGKPVGDGKNSLLFHLFQPAEPLVRHFRVLTDMLNQKNKKAAALKVLTAMLRIFWPPAVLGMAAFAILLTPVFMAAGGHSLLPAFTAALVLGGASALVLWILAGLLGLPESVLAAVCQVIVPIALLTLLYSLPLVGASPPVALLVALISIIVLPACLVLALSATALLFGKSLLDGMAKNFYGICSGHQEPADQRPQALTDWLTQYFDQLAGLSDQPMPLTFGHLWGAPPNLAAINTYQDVENLSNEMPRADRKLNLEVMTTAVSKNMAFAIPFRERSEPFFYDPQEWSALFPERVMTYLNQVADHIEGIKQQNARHNHQRRPLPEFGDRQLRRLPPNCFLPVVVAVRMSLSFPILLSAIPLYSRDYTMADHPMKRVWFSDGGLSSNIPLHMFDAPLPNHPTFAVNLKEMQPETPRVHLPQNNGGNQSRFWKEPPTDSFGLFNLLWEMVNTMQSWRDEIQFPYPGYRDRIVQISQRDNEGGLNLNMPKEVIEELSHAGGQAADLLIQRFNPPPGAPNGWEDHQELRLKTFLSLLEEISLNPTVLAPHWDQVANRCYQTRGPASALARRLLQRLRDMNADILQTQVMSPHITLGKEAPRPRPTLRITPKI